MMSLQMRKFTMVLFSMAAALASFSQQQPENAGFEQWESVGLNTPEPVDWSSIKTSDNSGLNNLAPYVWDQSTDAHSGSYSVKLFNASVLTIVAAGTLTNGRVHSDLNPNNGYVFTNTSDPHWNTPFTDTPDSVVVWAKFTPASGDIAQIKAVLHTGTAKIPDATQANWIALAQIDIPNQVNNWTRFSAPFNYFNSNIPQYILFVLSSGGTVAHVGTTAYFDDLQLIYNPAELDITVFLQGPYSGNSLMATALNPYFLPLTQPFSGEPWNYTGTESVPAIPNGSVVDWILVELRDAPSAAAATSAATVARQAGFVLSDGSIVGLDGSERLTVPVMISQNLFVVLWHRNHIGIMSANPLTESAGIYTYNFSDTGTKIYGSGNGFVQLESGFPGLWGMAGGDGNADGTVNSADKNSFWSILAGTSGYLPGDYNLNGHINNPDKNDFWQPNQGKGCEVPE
jgi:hypothetical protein